MRATAQTPTSVATLKLLSRVVWRGGVQGLRHSPVGVIATPCFTFMSTALLPSATYNPCVAAIDSLGRASPIAGVNIITPAAPPCPSIDSRWASWKRRLNSAARTTEWREKAFDDNTWASGAAVLEWNMPGMTTELSVGVPAPCPISAQFRRSFNVSDASAFTSARVSVIAIDGAVVFSSCAEIGSANMPAGVVSQTSYATVAPSSAAAAAARLTIDVLVAMLVIGENTVAASTHVNFSSTPDVSSDLSFYATP